MKLNNKGYMLVEIIVSSAIALIMAYFLIDITLRLVNRNNDYYVETTLISDKNLITKELMDDLNNNDYLLTDIVVDNNAKSANFKFKKLSDNNTLTKNLTINNNTLTYGNYTKKLSNDLTIKSINVTKDETKKQVYISIPAYTNYSDINYGINIVMPYTSEVNVVMPEIMFDVELTIANGSIDNNKLRVKINNNAVFEGITPNKGYTLVKETDTCNGTLDSSGKYTISTIVDNKKCTLTLKKENNNLDTSGANSPDLVEGLIPVMYKDSKWVVADYTNTDENYKWYDYDSKLWANAVLVTETKRNNLTKDSNGNYIKGQTIGDTESSGTLAFYVWIPRYKYKVWNINKVIGTDSYDARTTGIDIVFESDKEKSGTISCTYDFSVTEGNKLSESCTGSNGDYYTHPAFTFGSNEVRGFWIGKYEVSSSNPETGESYGGGESNNLTIRILPNVTSWRSNFISYFNTVIQNTQISNNIYGLNTSRTVADSHMLTNYEWGAVAYLTNSKYGKCTNNSCSEVEKNSYGEINYYTTMTGCGPTSSESISYNTTCNTYNTTLGMTASTTGNITGLYDISGGAYEYVMGNMSSESGNYTFYPSSSSFASNWYNDSTAKYITTYAYDSSYEANQTTYNRGRLGDATGEVMLTSSYNGGWYGDYTYFPYYNYPWFYRGGNYDFGSIFSFGSKPGPFGFPGHGSDYDSGGNSSALISTRAALVSLK